MQLQHPRPYQRPFLSKVVVDGRIYGDRILHHISSLPSPSFFEAAATVLALVKKKIFFVPLDLLCLMWTRPTNIPDGHRNG